MHRPRRSSYPDNACALPKRWPFAFTLLLVLLLPGCAGVYFHEAPAPDEPASLSPDELPWQEYWTGIIFNGNKIGFSHLSLEPSGSGPGQFVISSEAALRFRFLALDKKVNLTARDWIDRDLQLVRFAYNYDLDGNLLDISGEAADGDMVVRTVSGGEEEMQSISRDTPLYPTSIINLYPAFHGLQIGRRYEYRVYDGETRQVTTVTQEILGYETSELFEGAAYRIRTTMYGTEVETWISAQGMPLLERAMRGVFVSGLESEAMAQRYLTLAALNKQESLLDFSLVRSEPAISSPRRITSLEVALHGIDPRIDVPDDSYQQCTREGDAVRCRIPSGATPAPPTATMLAHYLEPSVPVRSRSPAIVRMAAEIAEGAVAPGDRIAALVEWQEKNVQREPVDVFSALDVLETRKAECQGHSYLYASFARSLGIPTRIVNGLAYSEEHGGFLYHTWAESWTGNRWLAVDPTLGQVPADATHIKLVEGENLADLAPLLHVLGRIRAEVVSARLQD